MIFSSELLSKAKSEFIEAYKWYEDRQPGLGEKFKRQIYDCIKIIEEHPERYPERKKKYREGFVNIFPYLLIYRIYKRKKIIAILSVFHTGRNPKKKYTK